MKVVSYTIILYGADYVDYALRSVQSNVDQSNIIYTPHPSHGHTTNQPLVETFNDIQSAVSVSANWYESTARYEGQQRDLAVQQCINDGADLILVLDYDEIWHADMLAQALEYVWKQNNNRNWLINFTHLWRSFSYCCRDEGRPVRIIDTRHRTGTGYIPKEFGEIYHFGYAITDKVMQYKWEIHGHKNEIRPNWMNEKWLGWYPGIGDVHPTNAKGFWNPEPFDKTTLPALMKSHPFYELDIIR